MIKVYGSLKMIFWLCFFFCLPLYVWVRQGGYPSSHISLIFPITFIFLFGTCLFFSFFPSWAYGEEGIELRDTINGKPLAKYAWKDVLAISHDTLPNTRVIDWVVLEMKDGKKIVISFFLTRAYSRVLSDVVGYARKRSSETYISPWVDKKISKRE